MAEHCRIHAEESGELRRATSFDPDHGPVCSPCAKDLGAARTADRYEARTEAYAAHEED